MNKINSITINRNKSIENMATYKKIRTIILSIILLYMIIEIVQKYILINYYYEYSDGIIVDIQKNRVAKKIITYSYVIRGHQYVRGMTYERHMPCENFSHKCKGDRVLVKYLPWNPKISRVIIE
jgi:hypothetical protein